MVTSTKYQFQRRAVKLVTLLVFVNNMATNVDHGAIPSATKLLKEDLHLNNEQLGFLGSLVFLGLTLGSVFATVVFNNIWSY